jgi:asparagine synthase (glutamine-hydrolysing)
VHRKKHHCFTYSQLLDMCGITGFVGKGTEADLLRMTTSLRYRGPDFQGGQVVENVGFGHARLSIIDLSEGANQPFFNPDKSIGMVFNGEIYNYLANKEYLHKLNKYTFSTTSDTEVLLYLYQEFGLGMFEKLNGMFAFGLYDFQKKQMLLARDRMGKKPLYYGVFGNTLVYASEPKAILQHPLVSKELNLDALNAYLTFDYVPTPLSIFKNIHKLEPGHYLIFKDGAIQEKKAFWNITFKHQDIGFEDAKTQLDALLNDATACRLVADVPLGIFLSGGLDSSTVAYYAQKNSSTPIKTYSIGFEEKSYDETDYAKAVAEKLGTDHHLQILTGQDSVKLVPEILPKLDEPFADPSVIPTYLLSKFTRQEVTVALGGDGSDELMAGYPTFTSEYFRPYYAAMPQFIKALTTKLAGVLPVNDGNISLDFKVKQFLKGFEANPRYTHTLWMGSFTPNNKQQLFSAQALSQITNGHGLQAVDAAIAEVPNANAFDQLLNTYYRTYLIDDILVKVDRASMYASLEVRAPFLDYRVVDFLNSLPKAYKQQGYKTGKHILKELMRDKLPNDIIDRPKKGFGIPLSSWLRQDLKPFCNELLSESALQAHGLFNSDYVQQLKNEHFAVKQNHRKLLWNLMVFQSWYQNYLR